MQAQMKTFHYWLSWAQLIIGVVVASADGLLSPKSMQWFIVINALVNKAIAMMAAKWQPDEEPKLALPGEIAKAKSTDEEPK